ncbi:MAG: hydroxymethylbilane synthase [Candidatus Omnitrophota bacterium]
MSIRVGTRPSRLAFRQVEEIKCLVSGVEFVVIPIQTQGDKDKITPLSSVREPDFFTREIDEALLDGKIDIAIHSSKDLSPILTDGLVIFFETESISRFDVLVSRDNFKLHQLSKHSRIGVSSQRRRDAVYLLRPDLELIDVRGNIDERIRLLDENKIDALIVAEAALIRLDLENRISEIFPLDLFETHPKQGSLSLVAREDRWQKLKSILSAPGLVIGN